MRPKPRVVHAIAALGMALCVPAVRAQEPAKSATLARFFPGKDLVAYAEFDGLDAHEAAWKRTATYRLLTETPTGAMLDSLLSQLADRLVESSPPASDKPTGADLVTVAKHLVRSGFAFGINRRAGEPKPYSIGLVIRDGSSGRAGKPIARLLASASGPGTKTETVAKPGSRQVEVVADRGGAGFAWWSEKGDLAMSLVMPRNVDAMIDSLDGRVPNAVEAPARAALSKTSEGFEPVGLAFFDMAALPTLPPQAKTLGLDRLKRVDYRWGFQGDALMTVLRISAPAPRTGVLALLDQPTFSAKTLPPIPKGVNGFAVFSLDADRIYEQLGSLAAASDPKARIQMNQMEAAFKDATGQALRQDILKHLGPRIATYTVPTRGNLPTNALMGFVSGAVHVSRTVALVEIRDADAFAKSLDSLVDQSNKAIRAQIGEGDPAKAAGWGFLPLKGDRKGYVLALPPSVLPIPAGMRPTLVVGKKYLVIGTTPDVARRAVAIEDQAGVAAEGELAAALERLPKDLILLSVEDTRESLLPEIVANLPSLLGFFTSPNAGPRGTTFLRMMGMPIQLGGPELAKHALMIDADTIPSPDDLRPFLFPATYAMTADAEGFTIVSRESFPSLSPTTALPLAAAALLPATTASRSAARRSQSTNNLKQIGLAMHNFASANDKLPGPIRDKDGKPLLSWRVAILPYLEQGNLYNEFKLDEPWDSPHNKPLMDRMPNVFVVPDGNDAEPGKTFYRSFSGTSALFDPKDKNGVGFASITDGLSNTIAVVEAREAVEWTKPDNELPFDHKAKDAQALLGNLGGHWPGGFNALFLDGAVRFIKESIDPVTLKALITRDGGEVVSGDSF